MKKELRERAKRLNEDIPAVSLALRLPETPKSAKIFAILCMIYAFSPIDLVPDFVPVIGYLDDLIIIPALCAAAIRRIPPETLELCREEAKDLKREKRWYFAIPFVIVWAAVIAVIVKLIISLK